MDAFVHIGSDTKAVDATKKALLEIMSAHADQATIRAAIAAFVAGIQPRNITVSNCTFTIRQPNSKRKAKQ